MSAFDTFEQSVDRAVDRLEDSLDHHAAAAGGHHGGHHAAAGGHHAAEGTCSIKVYGADWCGWTRKQKEELEKNGVNFDYYDCSKDGEKCPSGIQGFPTLEVNGKRTAGYKDPEHLKNLCQA